MKAQISSADVAHFPLQMLEANSMKGGVELLEIRPEQLTTNDLGAEQVLWTKTSMMCTAACTLSLLRGGG